MTLATLEPPGTARPTFARLYDEVDRMLDRYIDAQREIDAWLFIGLDRGMRFELERVIEYVES